ncbi:MULTISPECIES: hypothetical protein [Actinomadura]|uniref:Uncharacterized protein n=1 Tax=Actinomadura citrea TaxID=46158 RepID=A0A7Y9KAJ1_9ACTN|nr:hypothetical protein [Actinomadura citrea]NYE10221.1 hypothetical protein [Actinomadura citrea]GGT70895.1 hypothetical protein GCM10010177_30590 [Actinomadura citrea]
MRRVAIVTVLSGALAAGVLAAGPAAQAETKPADKFGKEVTTTSQEALSKKDLISEAQTSGQPLTAAEKYSVQAAEYCRTYTRIRGYKASNGKWIIAVTNRLNWCYNGSYVTRYRASYKAYTYNKYKWVWKGWAMKKVTHPSNWAYATSYAQGAFRYTGNGKTYKPYVIIRGYKNGAYKWKAGG